MRCSSIHFFVMSLSLLGSAFAQTNSSSISLAGTWRFQIDRNNRGAAERWFEHPLADSIELPGSMPGQGRGDPVTVDTHWTGSMVDKSYFTEPRFAEYRQPGNIKVPFWLQPDHYYAGVAWYQREINIPANWANRRVVLALERPHWETQVWLDAQPLGTNHSLSTKHEYELGAGLTPGHHVISIRIDNGRVVEIGENSHSISDHTQGNWNGIVGRLELTATAPVWIDDLQVYPQIAPKAARVAGRIGRSAAATLPKRVAVSVARSTTDDTREKPAELWLDVSADGTFSGE